MIFIKNCISKAQYFITKKEYKSWVEKKFLKEFHLFEDPLYESLWNEEVFFLCFEDIIVYSV